MKETREQHRKKCRHFKDDMCMKLSEGLAINVGCFGDCKRMIDYDKKQTQNGKRNMEAY